MTSPNADRDIDVALIDDDPNVVGSSAWIERDQFVYFVTMARELGSPHHWRTFRDELVAALRAAWGLDAIWLNLDTNAQHARRAMRISLAYDLVDEARERHDPAVDWDGYMESLWSSRCSLTDTA